MREVIEEFDAKSEAGTVYRLVVSRSRINTTSLQSNGRESRPGLPGIETAEGWKVNHIDDHTFRLVKTGEILKRV